MQGTVQKSEIKPQEKLKDDFYKCVVERLEQKKSKKVGEEDYFMVYVRTMGGKQLSYFISQTPTLTNHHGKMLNAMNGELFDGMAFNTDTYVGKELEVYFEWSELKQKMVADKFRPLSREE